MNYTYLWINFCTIIIPFLFSFHPKLKFYKNFRFFFIANSIVAILFVLWDAYFTDLGVWGFNPNYLTGLGVFNLPLEEVLFFVCIPFSCVFTYHCLNLFFDLSWRPGIELVFVLLLSSILLGLGIYFFDQYYTSYTFISLGILLLIIKFLLKPEWLGSLFTIYTILLLPFFVVNGILTGTGLESPVVWYNNEENLTIRLLTIPVEDIFYGFELILLNVLLYEYFKSKHSTQKDSRLSIKR